MGEASGNIQSITNSKADGSRAAITKATNTAFEAKRAALESYVRAHGVNPKIEWDLNEYEETLTRLKANPTLKTWTELQQKKADLKSAPNSAPSSRSGSPTLK